MGICNCVLPNPYGCHACNPPYERPHYPPIEWPYSPWHEPCPCCMHHRRRVWGPMVTGTTSTEIRIETTDPPPLDTNQEPW